MSHIEQKTWSKKLSSFFVAIGEFTYTHPKFSVLAYAAVIGFFAWQLQHLTIDTTIEGFLDKDDPAIGTYDDFRRKFGRDEMITVGLEPKQVFDLEFLRQLQQVHERLEVEVPFVQEVDSILNARNVYGTSSEAGDELIVEDLFENFPTSQTDLDRIRNIAMANPVYRGSLLSADGTMTTLMVKLVPYYREETGDPNKPYVEKNLADVQFGQATKKIKEIMAEYPLIGGNAFMAGTIPMTADLTAAMTHDFSLFTAICLGIIGVVLWIIFRTLAAVFLPLLVMIFSMLVTIATMALFGTPMQMSTTILPSFLLAACVGDSIHWLSLFYQRYPRPEQKHEAIMAALRHAAVPMLFTTLTTAAGLASFATAKITPVANLGLYGAVGAIAAFIVTITLMPVLIAIFPVKPRPVVAAGKGDNTLIHRFAVWSAEFAISKPWPIIISAIGLTLAGAYFMKDSKYSHNALLWFPENSELRTAVSHVEAKMGGTMIVEVLVDTGKERGVTNPDFLKALDELYTELEQYNNGNVRITKAIGLPALVKETNRGINGNNSDAYVIPDNAELIGQELLLVEMGGGKDLFRLIDGDYRLARTTVMLPWVDAIHYGDFIRELEAMFQAKVGEYGKIQPTGITPIMARTVAAMLSSMGNSYMYAMVVISLMLAFMLGSVRQGLVSMFPNFLPILLVLAFMAIIGSPLDMFSLLVGSIALGICVDDTIHFMHGFGQTYHATGDYKTAIRQTLSISGQGMVTTTIVLAFGFSIYRMSALRNLDHFGMLTGVCVGLALLADFWLAPALMAVMNRNKKGEA